MIYLKMAVVALVCLIAQIVAWRDLRRATWLMGSGILIVGVVVVYSAVPYVRNFHKTKDGR